MIESLRAARTLLLDTNLLVLYIVGLLGTRWIEAHKRTERYTVGDFELLHSIVSPKAPLVTTPHVLSEVSNLARQVREPLKSNLSLLLREICQLVDERYVESASITRSACFHRLGLTDAAIMELCGDGLLVLTDDLGLYLEISKAGGQAFNFNHLRQSALELS